ncbi:hypothetical protein ACHQM5_024714 [Ranunculus cassubicifolius]
MDERENGRHKQEQYKMHHSQWMIPPHMMKDHHAMTMKFMSILAERDAAIQERNLAISEKRAALAERDVAVMQREAAIAEKNTALLERDNALAALEYRDGCGRVSKHMHHHMNESPPPYRKDMNICDALPISMAPSRVVRVKRTKKGITKLPSKKGKKERQVPFAKPLEWTNEEQGEDLNKQVAVCFDDSSMAVPGCSCTGVFQQCYRWGKGGWQSACCTTTLSMYPLPVMPNKRHARLGGRKMSGSAYAKLLSRLALEGHDLSTPLDLKEHWAKHGTNRYITIK